MDAASVIAARALQVEPWHHVLDLCASPGGKSLILASALFNESGVNYDRSITKKPGFVTKNSKKQIRKIR